MIQVSVVDGVGMIRFDSPQKRNALSHELLSQLMAALEGFNTQHVRVVILRAGPDVTVWSSGHDISELPRDGRDPLGEESLLERALRAVRAYPGPVVAMVHGSVWGGAFDLAMSCDLVVADETASFAITPANIGLPYNTAGIRHFLYRLPLNLIKELFFTAASLSARDAERWGVVNHLVPASELEAFTLAMAQKIAQKAPLSIQVVKEQLRVICDEWALPAPTSARIEALRRQAYQGHDYQEGIAAFLEKRLPVFTGE